jgi:cytochrome c5
LQLIESERSLFDNFTTILGIFIGAVVAAALFLSADFLSGSLPMTAEETESATVEDRIAPVGRVALLGDEELIAAAAAITTTPAPVATTLSGPQVFNEACYLCHAPPGVPGAPVLGDAAAWEARIAQGIEVLKDHALNGYTGSAGFMPPKGGRVDLSDEEVSEAVEYMVEQVSP